MSASPNPSLMLNLTLALTVPLFLTLTLVLRLTLSEAPGSKCAYPSVCYWLSLSLLILAVSTGVQDYPGEEGTRWHHG